ncbi:MAG: sigma-70 family RNA polymerase sigma factor [Planctomycetes bacterium]|nr:sigma-70 family RNA polymerase sigma factor [Planctomycetota bacterium]
MTDTPDEPQDWRERLREGDEECLAELFSRCRERLWRIVHFRLDARLRGRVDADDVLQEAYLNAAQRIRHSFTDSVDNFFLWLRLIVNQTLIDLHRRHLDAQARDAGREVALEAGSESRSTSVSVAFQLAGSLTSPSQAAMRAEAVRKLEEALDSMDPIDREVLALRHFEELSNSEVAAVLGIQQKAASIRYVRALDRLKRILSRVPGLQETGGGS